MRLSLKDRINVESKIKRVEKEQGSRKGGSDGEPSGGRLQLKQANRACLFGMKGAAALLDNEVAF